MDMTNAKLAPTIKRVAQNVASIVKQKNQLKDKMDKLEEQYKQKLEEKLAKYKQEYDELVRQQEVFEAPIRELTGGYSTEDLVTIETVEAGTDKNGKVINKTRYVLKYPETIVPPAEEMSDNGEPVNATAAEMPTPEPVDAGPSAFEPKESDEDELPFQN